MRSGPKIGICTDSSSQLPRALRDRYDIEVVPLTVSVNGHEYLEDVDLDADEFWAQFAGGRRPEVSTAEPSPGQFALAYESLIERGATEILSVHVAGAISATLRAARLAAHNAAVPVRLVDSGTASFGVTCCVWAAALAAENGATLDEAAVIAESVAATLGNVFVVGAPDLARAGGRARVPVEELSAGQLPVMTLESGDARVIDTVTEVRQAADVMVRYIESRGTELLVAVGLADPHGAPVSEAVFEALNTSSHVREVIRYRIGPSVGAHVGPGTAGAWVFPAPSTAGSTAVAADVP